jgi:hypothetical protein
MASTTELSDPASGFVGWDRSAEEVALGGIAAHDRQLIPDLGGFNALGHHAEPEVLAELNG